jgi:hypothetical protein
LIVHAPKLSETEKKGALPVLPSRKQEMKKFTPEASASSDDHQDHQASQTRKHHPSDLLHGGIGRIFSRKC